MLKNIDESKLTPGFIQPVKKIVDSRVDKVSDNINDINCLKLFENYRKT